MPPPAVLVLSGHVLVGSAAVLVERPHSESRRSSTRHSPLPPPPAPSAAERVDCQSDSLTEEEVGGGGSEGV